MPSTVATKFHSKVRESVVGSSRRSRWLVGGSLAALVLIATACGSSGASTTTTKAGSQTRTTSAVTVKTAHSATLGTLLVDQSGLTLYRYTPDGTGKTTCTGACAAAWPPFTLPSGTTHAAAGAGVAASALGTITRPGGALQVTFEGMPLYRFSGDSKAGDTKGQGVAGTWVVVSPTTTPTPTSTPAAPAASGSSPPTTTAAPMAAPSPRSGGVTPATAPPATAPPATAPPATAPPATAPPATTPPTTHPPVTTTTSGGGYGY